ncbi:MAG: chemotaxis protein MotB [Planctomycetota bacterium]|jgi:chemotaxis protein MotB
MAAPVQEFVRPKGAPMWIVTFTDMISLLLTFFILILTFSSMEEEKMQQATGSLSGAFGVLSDPGRPPRTETQKSLTYKFRKRDENGVTDPSLRPSEVKDAVRGVQDRLKYNVAIETTDLERGVLLDLKSNGDKEIFVLGTSKLNPWATSLLREIATEFRDLPMRICVETHIDSKTPELIGEDPRTLTLEMALSVAALIVKQGFSPERVSASPMGDFYRIASNDKPLDRFRNRRLRIRVLPTWQDEIIREKRER